MELNDLKQTASAEMLSACRQGIRVDLRMDPVTANSVLAAIQFAAGLGLFSGSVETRLRAVGGAMQKQLDKCGPSIATVNAAGWAWPLEDTATDDHATAPGGPTG